MTTKRVSLLHIFLVFILCSPVGMSFMTSTAYASVEDSNPLRSDVNGDGVVNILDVSIISIAWSSYLGHHDWDPRADVNNDGNVNMLDMVSVAKNFGIMWVRYDFDEPPDWNLVSGTWNTSNGSLEGFSNPEGLIYTRNMTWKDCTLTAKVKIAPDSPEAEASLCFRFVDSGNFYWAGLGCWGHKVSVSRMSNHVPQELIFSGGSADIIKDVWYKVSIEISGDAIMLYVNDVLELTVNDSTFTSGSIGARLWGAHILVDYLTVAGSQSPMPPNSNLEVYRGFAVHAPLSYSPELTQQKFGAIKDWGFNYVLFTVWWDEFEPEIGAAGVYNENNLLRMRTMVDRARSAGLDVFISVRVDYGVGVSWDGPYTHDYANLDEYGRQRYARLWEMIAQRFPDCMYVPWHMPYHDTYCDSNRRNIYLTKTFPALLNAIRKYSNNKVVFVPIYQNPQYYPSSPFNDSNIIYGIGHVTTGPVSYGNEAWNYNYADIDNYLTNVKQWRQNYPDIQMMSVEFGGIGYRSLPIDQSRLDCLEYACKKMSEYEAGWMYWVISLKVSSDTILKDMADFVPEENLLSILQEY